MKTTLMSLPSVSSLDFLGGGTGEDDPHESSFSSIGSLADITGMEDQFRNPLSTFSRDGDNSKSFEKGSD